MRWNITLEWSSALKTGTTINRNILVRKICEVPGGLRTTTAIATWMASTSKVTSLTRLHSRVLIMAYIGIDGANLTCIPSEWNSVKWRSDRTNKPHGNTSCSSVQTLNDHWCWNKATWCYWHCAILEINRETLNYVKKMCWVWRTGSCPRRRG